MRDTNLWVVCSPIEAITNSVKDRLWRMHSWERNVCYGYALKQACMPHILTGDGTLRHNTFLGKWMSSRHINHKGDMSIVSQNNHHHTDIHTQRNSRPDPPLQPSQSLTVNIISNIWRVKMITWERLFGGSLQKLGPNGHLGDRLDHMWRDICLPTLWLASRSRVGTIVFKFGDITPHSF